MIGGHGHVTPRPDGMKARCGGPAICSDCALEYAQLHRNPVTSEAPPAEPQLADFQKRVICERRELDQKICALDAFMAGSTFRSVDRDEQDRLRAQHHAMILYSYFLAARISAFVPEVKISPE